MSRGTLSSGLKKKGLGELSFSFFVLIGMQHVQALLVGLRHFLSLFLGGSGTDPERLGAR